jgi:L-lactate dehydrogenase complex protein LldG
LVAQTGSIVLSDSMTQTREAYALPDILLVYATTEQIVPGMRTAFQTIKRKYAKNKPSQLTFITGPSRSTDIEQTLVIGASGIRQVAVFLVDEE